MAASAAVVDETKLHGEIFTDYKLKHSEKLLPLIDTLFKELRIGFSDMDAFALSSGPGSFTGLRIEAATVKAFAHATGKPIIGVSTPEALAYAHIYTSAVICPILDAQQSSVYTALFRSDDAGLHRLTVDAAVPIKDLMETLAEYQRVLFCGDAVIKLRGMIADEMKERAIFANPQTMMLKASAIGFLAIEKYKNNELAYYQNYLPNYIRASQAEVNYEVKLM